MERIVSIIQQLQAAVESHQDLSQLQVLSQLLHAEIAKLQSGNQAPTHSGRVAVVLPSSSVVITANEPPLPAQVMSTQQPAPEPAEKVFEILRVDEAELEAELEEIRQKADYVRKVQVQPKMVPGLLFEEEPDVPTLVHQPNYTPPPKKEVNEVVSLQQPTLNEQLASPASEVSEKLSAQPVKDLRKAIGVNDRYVFINELFRGDEDMYERSIKTINNFSIYAEAEYWIQRELKIKLGWNDSDAAAASFYALVRRRFS